jgi:hypothetical protein
MAVGFASWRRPGGTTQVVEVIGAEPDAGARLPLPRIGPSSLRRHAALVDASARTNLGLAAEPDEIEVNGRRLAVRAHLRGFGSFLGSPYLFTGYEDAEEILGFSALRTGFLGWLVGLALVIPGVSVARGLVAWIWTPLWLPPSLLLVSLAMCGLASLVAARRAVVVDPELVLRE